MNILENLQGIIGIEKVWIVIIAFLIFLWLVSIIGVAKDISARTDSYFLQIISILMITLLTPIVGGLLYLAIRPAGYKYDRNPWRESCISNSSICQNCGAMNPREYKCCIKCGKKLMTKCKECGNEYPHDYHYCPICGAPNIEQK